MPERPWTIGRYRGGFALVYYVGKTRHRHALGCRDAGEAERIAPALYTALTRPKGTTVAELWNAYTTDKSGRSVVTRMAYSWKALEVRFGALPAEEITVEHCRAQVRARRLAGIQDGTIHTEMGHLRMVLVWAKKHKLIAEAPFIERPSKPPPSEKHLTREQARSLIDAASVPHVRLFIILALGTGARNAALLGLTWERVNFETGMIDLRDPTIRMPHKGRAVVPMNRTVRAALAEAKAGAMTPYVIEWAGAPVVSVKKGLASAARKAAVPWVTPHVFRHSTAVHLVEAGRPMHEVGQFLGHTDLKTTERVYARFSDTYLREAAGVLEYDDLAPVKKARKA